MPRITVTIAGRQSTIDYTVPAPTALKHPGVVYSAELIADRAARLAAKVNPYTAQLSNLKTRKAGSGANNGKVYCDLAWVPTAIAEVGRGSSGSPNQGASDLLADTTAALVDAMLWAFTGDRRYASKCAEILNVWASTITKILFDTTTWGDGKLLASWAGTLMGRAVELVRRSSYTARAGEVVPNWANIDKMMRNVLLPRATEWHNGSGGNWIATFVDATVQLGVALDDKAVFQLGVDRWRRVVPSLFWMPTDVNPYPNLKGLPLVPPWTMWDNANTTAATLKSIWGNPTSWPAGLEFETFRDLHHMTMAFASIANAAETAWIQGIDLYGEEKARLVTACELATRWVYEKWVKGIVPAGWPFSSGPNGYETATQRASWEIFYNHFAHRLGQPMPNTLRLLTEYTRPNTFDVDMQCVAEQLTHQDAP